MTNYLTIRNNCPQVKIHCAISWATFQQDFRNDIPPRGGYVEYELGDIGWHDLVIVMGTAGNRFLPANNGRSLVLEAIVKLYGDFFLEFKLPDLTPRQVKVVDGVQLKASSLVIPAIYTPDGNDVVVTGGDIHGSVDKNGDYVVTRIDPLSARWSNRLSPKGEKTYVAAA